MRYLIPPTVLLVISLACPGFCADADLSAVKHAVDEGRLLEANLLYKDLVGKYPKRADLHCSYGLFLQNTGQMALSVSEFQSALKLDPRQSTACLALAEISLQLLDVDSALRYSQSALAIDPTSTQARIVHIKALMQSGHTTRADEELSELLSGVSDADVLHLAYQVKARKGDFLKARNYLQEAVKAKPEHTDWVVELCQLLENRGDSRTSRAYLNALLERNPNAVDARLCLARNLETYEYDYDGAIAQYQSALQIDPGLPAALAGIDRCRAEKNDLARSLKLTVQSFFTRR